MKRKQLRRFISFLTVIALLMSFTTSAFAVAKDAGLDVGNNSNSGYKINRAEPEESGSEVEGDVADVVAADGAITFSVIDLTGMEGTALYVIHGSEATISGDVYASSTADPAAIRANGEDVVITAGDVYAYDSSTGLINGVVAGSGAEISVGNVTVGAATAVLNENMTAAESRLRDTEMADEMAADSRMRDTDMADEMGDGNLLAQANQSMIRDDEMADEIGDGNLLAQANQSMIRDDEMADEMGDGNLLAQANQSMIRDDEMATEIGGGLIGQGNQDLLGDDEADLQEHLIKSYRGTANGVVVESGATVTVNGDVTVDIANRIEPDENTVVVADDYDMATDMIEYTKNNILRQGSEEMSSTEVSSTKSSSKMSAGQSMLDTGISTKTRALDDNNVNYATGVAVTIGEATVTGDVSAISTDNSVAVVSYPGGHVQTSASQQGIVNCESTTSNLYVGGNVSAVATGENAQATGAYLVGGNITIGGDISADADRARTAYVTASSEGTGSVLVVGGNLIGNDTADSMAIEIIGRNTVVVEGAIESGNTAFVLGEDADQSIIIVGEITVPTGSYVGDATAMREAQNDIATRKAIAARIDATVISMPDETVSFPEDVEPDGYFEGYPFLYDAETDTSTVYGSDAIASCKGNLGEEIVSPGITPVDEAAETAFMTNNVYYIVKGVENASSVTLSDGSDMVTVGVQDKDYTVVQEGQTFIVTKNGNRTAVRSNHATIVDNEDGTITVYVNRGGDLEILELPAVITPPAENNEPENNEPESDESENSEPENNESENNEPENNESESDGPKEKVPENNAEVSPIINAVITENTDGSLNVVIEREDGVTVYTAKPKQYKVEVSEDGLSFTLNMKPGALKDITFNKKRVEVANYTVTTDENGNTVVTFLKSFIDGAKDEGGKLVFNSADGSATFEFGA